MPSKKRTIVSWVLRIAVALIFLQTLFFKFTGADEAVYIFSQLGVEPWGRYLTGLGELGAAVLLLIPATAVFGALLSLAVITGALLSHLFVLGIVVQNDGGMLFGMAVFVLLASLALLWLHRAELRCPFAAPGGKCCQSKQEEGTT